MSPTEPPATTPPRRALICALVAATVIILGLTLAAPSSLVRLNSEAGIGSVIGFSLAAMSIVGGGAYGVLHATVLRGANRRHRPAYAAILVGWCLLVSSGGAILLHAPARSSDIGCDAAAPC